MNKIQSRLRLITAVLAGAAMLLLSGAGMADPPTRVARLGFFSGPVSFSPAGEEEWVLAIPNRPLITGDRLWSDVGGRAELQAGSVALRLGASTNVNVLNLDDRTTQVELTQGSLYVRVWRIDRGDTVEIDTPTLAFTVSSVGRYRIDVDSDGNVTTLAVLAGGGEAYGEGAAYRIGAGDRYSFSGTGLRDYEYSDIGAPDEFDRWAAERDRRYETSISARYVSRDVIGYQDLDQYGTWSVVADYGNVWYPRSTPSGWAPYRTGHWAWIDPWGWTWVDDAPWGFAPYHYGRWAFVTGRWGWIPGPVNVRPIYAPALVAFIGGGDFRLSLSVGGAASGIAWFPLGPGEVYQPAYRVSRDYFTNVNVSNTRITNVNITNVYNNYATNTAVTNVTYRNREAPGAVTAVPAAAFVQSQPVARAAVQVPRDLVMQQPVSAVARVAPTHASLVAAPAAGAAGPGRPPARALQREVVARTKPPAPPPAFAARQAALAANPGRPTEHAAAASPQPVAAGAAPARNVKVVTPTQAAAAAPKEESRRGRGQLERRAGGPGALQGAPAGPQAAPAGQPGAPATGQPPRGAAQGGEPPPGADAARRARQGGQRPAEAGKGPVTESPAQKGAETPPAPRPPERGAGRPPQTPTPSAPPEGAKGTPPPKGEAVPPSPGGQGRDRNERRGPPEGGQGGQGGPAAAPPPPPPPRPAEAVKSAPPKSEVVPVVPQPPGGQGRNRNERRGPPEGGQGGQGGPAAAPPPPPRPPEAAKGPPPREVPKAEPKGEQGRGRNKDKDQKDKDKKESEG
ncbi:MAG: DUF6600 domain-containing protein [Betaproteobacteria bacterium]